MSDLNTPIGQAFLVQMFEAFLKTCGDKLDDNDRKKIKAAQMECANRSIELAVEQTANKLADDIDAELDRRTSEKQDEKR